MRAGSLPLACWECVLKCIIEGYKQEAGSYATFYQVLRRLIQVCSWTSLKKKPKDPTFLLQCCATISGRSPYYQLSLCNLCCGSKT